MITSRASKRPIAAAKRGQIIQRVLVDGWSPARAAAAFAVEPRAVEAWVRAYRRRGMESLRHDAVADDHLLRVLARRLRRALARVFRGREPASCVILRQSGDQRRRPR